MWSFYNLETILGNCLHLTDEETKCLILDPHSRAESLTTQHLNQRTCEMF